MDINIGWPEGIYLALMFLNLVIAASMNGQKKDGEYNFGLTLITSSLVIGLLYWGSFFN